MRTLVCTSALVALSGLTMLTGCGDDGDGDTDTDAGKDGGTGHEDGGHEDGGHEDGGTTGGSDGGGNGGGCPDHPNVETAKGVCEISGTIKKDLTLTADNAYLLMGGVFVGDDPCKKADAPDLDVTLTIEAGTVIYGDPSSEAFLSVSRGAKIEAVGTQDKPIVFTSAKNKGERKTGDWGGLILNGRASLNIMDYPIISEGNAGCYGGDMDDDDSGTLKYVRVEFGGKQFTSEDELNGIAFQGVGSKTEIDYVQAHLNNDDGMEFFGGTVNASHLVITGSGDDGFDWTLGWRGTVEYAIIQQHDGLGDRGIEADGNEMNNTAEPFSNPTLMHFTMVTPSAGNRGITLRRGTMGTLEDFLVTGFGTCVDIDSRATVDNIEEGDLTFSESMLDCDVVSTQVAYCNDPADVADPDDGDPCEPGGVDTSKDDVTSDMLMDGDNEDTSVELVNGTSPTKPNFKGEGDAADRGAIPGDDWTEGWTAYPAD